MADQNPIGSVARREALKKLAAGAGAATTLPILGQGAALLGDPSKAVRACPSTHPAPPVDASWKPLFFDEHQNETVITLTEMIVPQTDTPGAKAALVNRFIDLVLNEEEPDMQKEFIEGLAWMDGRAFKQHGKPFVQLSPEEQIALLEPLADPGNKNPEDGPGVKFFLKIKDWTLYGYYTSQMGMEQELHYGGCTYHTEFPGACTHPEHQS